MPAILLAGPLAEPLTLAEAKTYLRVDHDAEDALIGSLITAARATVEALVADTARLPGLIRVDRGMVPAPGRAIAGIAIDVSAGHGAGADHVPSPLVEAVRVVLAHFYEHRDEQGPGAAFPARLGLLVAPYRVTRL